MRRRAQLADIKHGGKVVGVFSMASEMSSPCPRWEDVRALLAGLEVYIACLFQMPLWAQGDATARRALWIMRFLFWLHCIGLGVEYYENVA